MWETEAKIRKGGQGEDLEGPGVTCRELAFRPVMVRISLGAVADSDLYFRQRALVEMGGQSERCGWRGWSVKEGGLVRALLKSLRTNDARVERSLGQCSCIKQSGFQRVRQLGDLSDVGEDEGVTWILAWEAGWLDDRNLDTRCM